MISENVLGFLLPINRFSGDTSIKLEPIWFQTNPVITDSKDAQFESHEIAGRAEPVLIYRASGARKISLELTYLAHSAHYDVRWVANQIARIRALVYPIYSRNNVSAGVFAPPPMVLLNYGARYVNIPCVVDNYNLSYTEEEAIDVPSMLPLITKISLGLTTSYPYSTVPGHDDVAIQYTSSGDVRDDISSQISVAQEEAAVGFQKLKINYDSQPEHFNYSYKNDTPSNLNSAMNQVKDLSIYSFTGGTRRV